MTEDIAVISFAGRFPKSPSVKDYWDNLCAGKELMTFFSDDTLLQAGVSPDLIKDPLYIKSAPTLEDYDKFDAAFFKYPPIKSMSMDPQQRILLQISWETLERAGYALEEPKEKIGVFAGSGGTVANYLLEYAKIFPQISGTTGSVEHLGNDPHFLSTRVSYELNLEGPSFTVLTACSTSLVAVHLACQSLLNGECTMALAGGICIRVPHIAGYHWKQHEIYSSDGHCRPFDAKASGIVFGSGVGLVLLKPLSKALEDEDTIYAVIKGSAINNDGSHKLSYAASCVKGLSGCISAALKKANISADTIEYVEAHGTATAMGDPIEVTALNNVFKSSTSKKQYCALGSVKSNMGHLDSAAGIASLIKTVLMLYYKKIPPSINFESPNPKINFPNTAFYVPTQLKSWDKTDGPRRAAVNGLGIGGTNAFIVLEEAQTVERTIKKPIKPCYLFTVSAKTKSALNQRVKDLEAWLSEHKDDSVEDLSYTLNACRRHFDQRYAFVADSITALQSQLKNFLNEETHPVVENSEENANTLFEALEQNRDTYEEKIKSLAKVYLKGEDLDWDRLHRGESQRKLVLPTYPFEGKRYWYDDLAARLKQWE